MQAAYVDPQAHRSMDFVPFLYYAQKHLPLLGAYNNKNPSYSRVLAHACPLMDQILVPKGL